MGSKGKEQECSNKGSKTGGKEGAQEVESLGELPRACLKSLKYLTYLLGSEYLPYLLLLHPFPRFSFDLIIQVTFHWAFINHLLLTPKGNMVSLKERVEDARRSDTAKSTLLEVD